MTRLTKDAATAPRTFTASARRKIAALAAAVLLLIAVLALSGCGASDDDCRGEPGKVTAKDTDSHTSYSGTGKKRTSHTTTTYELTILKADGNTYEKDVSSEAYDWYKNGSKFPSAGKCEDGKVK